MFQIVHKEALCPKKGYEYEVRTVYAVDMSHDAFLVYNRYLHRFVWVCIDEYIPADAIEKAASAATETARK